MTVNNGRREASLIDIVDFSPSRSTETNSAGERKKKKKKRPSFIIHREIMKARAAITRCVTNGSRTKNQ